ncbi:hypothetical protein [Bradyrhizobium sp. BR 10289]|uniref:hypothetical protein n=1 Tax=Bradyrhizobium sp. BR 10289 TaxID=2749993 RepID=UPI001C64EBBE|nr:hypothetical protein [Bradyrhizobium sp. BR 10289]MBW7967799.1 hypothetical protein [Bradyrhizobium sp. BR 10289]
MTLSSSLTSLFDAPFVIAIWTLTPFVVGGPLLLRFLNYKPVTRCAVVQTLTKVLGTGCWLTFGTVAIKAFEHGLISLPISNLAVALLFTVTAGSSFLIERWCPDEQP